MAFFGSNGAGKTTLLNCIAGNIFPDSGIISFDGMLLMEGETLSCLIRIAGIMLCFFFTVSVSMLLGAYLKSYAAMGVFIFIWVAFMYLKEFSYVKYMVPIYYMEKIVNADMGIADTGSFGILVLLIAFYSTVSMVLGKRKFEKSDLV